MRYPADPPRAEEIIAVMQVAGSGSHRLLVRGLIDVLWSAGLQVSEAPALNESDVDPRRGSLLLRQGVAAVHPGATAAAESDDDHASRAREASLQLGIEDASVKLLAGSPLAALPKQTPPLASPRSAWAIRVPKG
jgi:hypothetical protein